MNELHIDKTHWKKYRFGDVAIQTKEVVDIENTDLTRYVAGEHMFSEDIHLRKWGTIGDGYLGPAFIRKFNKGDILYGSRRTYLKKVAIADFDGVTANTTFVIKANEDLIETVLLAHLMLSHDFTEYSVKNSRGSVNPYINWKDIADYEFLLPPKAEQKRLAELIWAADEVVEKEKREKEKMEEYKNMLITSTILNGPKSIVLNVLGKVIRGVSYKPEQVITKNDPNAFMLLRSNNISPNFKTNYTEVYYIDNSVLKSEQELCLGDIIICMSNGSKELVGKASEITEMPSVKSSVGSFCAIFRPHPDSQFVKYLFQSSEYRKQIALLLSGSNINNLKPSDIESISFNIKESFCSEDICFLKTTDENISCLTKQIELSQQIKQELINKII